MDIDMIRGDTLNIQFGIDSDIVLDLSSDDFKITFSLKQSATDNKYIFQKDKTAVTEISENTFVLRVAPEDTVDLIPGYYFYDIQLNIGDDVFTIAIGKLHLEIDITRPPVILPEFPYPDINGDNTIDSVDASSVLTAYMNLQNGEPTGLTPEQENLADCNRDGVIDSADASLIMGFYADTLSGLYPNTPEGWTEYMTRIFTTG